MLLEEQKDAYVWLFEVKHTFHYSQRLHERVEFESALKSKALIEKWLAFHTLPSKTGTSRLGIVVSKRIIPKAISRNRIKRLIREEFRNQTATKAFDVVVRLRKNVLAEEKVEFRRSLANLFIKASVI